VQRVARYDRASSTWDDWGNGQPDDDVFCVKVFNDQVLVGGNFSEFSSLVGSEFIVFWDVNAEEWNAVVNTPDSGVESIVANSTYCVVSGSFQNVGGGSALYVA
jgi:hypothetical protein